MLTDWLIYLDYLEENNHNTSFLRLITPITFGIIKCHHYIYNNGSGYGYVFGDGFGDGFGFGFGNGYGRGNGNGNGYGYDDDSGDGSGFGDSFVSSNDEEH